MNRTTSRSQEQGQTILLVAVSLVAILGLSALAIDVVTLYVARAEAQRAADAGALAGAQMLVTLGVTADPCNAGLANAAIPLATAQAQAVAQKNNIAGAPAQIVTPTFPNQSSIGTCPGAFGINPQVTVNLQRTGLPTFFSRIWGAALGIGQRDGNGGGIQSVGLGRLEFIGLRDSHRTQMPEADAAAELRPESLRDFKLRGGSHVHRCHHRHDHQSRSRWRDWKNFQSQRQLHGKPGMCSWHTNGESYASAA